MIIEKLLQCSVADAALLIGWDRIQIISCQILGFKILNNCFYESKVKFDSEVRKHENVLHYSFVYIILIYLYVPTDSCYN